MFLVVLHKKLDKTIQENRRSIKIFIDRADELRLMITNLSDIVLDNIRVQEETHSDVVAVAAAIQPKDPFILDETHSDSSENNNDSFLSKNAGYSKDNSNGSLDLFSTPHPAFSRQTSAHPLSSSDQIEKSKIESSADLGNDLDIFNDHKDNNHKTKHPELDNRSVKELKSLEDEILHALRRLERTKPNLSVGHGQGQETEQERENNKA